MRTSLLTTLFIALLMAILLTTGDPITGIVARGADKPPASRPAAESAPNGPVFGDSRNAMRIVFVSDRSGSMINTMVAVKDQMGKAVATLKPTQFFDIIFMQDTKFECFSKYDRKEGLVPATADAKRSAAKFLEGITACGTTDPIPAIEGAFAEKPDLIYFLTDGDFPDNDAILKTIAKLNPDHKVRVNTIAFVGDGDNDIAFVALLQKIARDSGGSYRKVKESELN